MRLVKEKSKIKNGFCVHWAKNSEPLSERLSSLFVKKELTIVLTYPTEHLQLRLMHLWRLAASRQWMVNTNIQLNLKVSFGTLLASINIQMNLFTKKNSLQLLLQFKELHPTATYVLKLITPSVLVVLQKMVQETKFTKQWSQKYLR